MAAILVLGLLVSEGSLAAGFPASSVSAGSFHSCAIKDGGAWCWGDNLNGQLGNGTDGTGTSSDVPVPVFGLSNGVTAISAGYNHTCAIRNGGVWCWGDNYQGQLGNGTQTASNVPVPATGLGSGMTILSVGSRYSCAGNALISRCWGLNSDWRAGNVIENNQRSLEPFPIGTPVAAGDLQALAAGIGNHTCAIVDAYPNGWCWGRNYDGQAGADPSKTDPHTGLSQQLIPDGQFLNPIMGESDIAAIAAGLNHTCLILNGGVMCMGKNDMGQLGDGTGVGDFNPHWVSGLGAGSNVTSIIAGTSYGCALSTTQGLKCWGSNDYGQFGNGTGVGADVPVSVSGFPSPVTAISGFATRTCAIADGGVWCTSPDHPGQGPQPVPEAPRVTISGPADGTETVESTVDVTFQTTGYPAPSCKVNGVDESGPTATVPLSLGGNQIEVVCTSSAGSDTATIAVIRYSPIRVTIAEPVADTVTAANSIDVSFKVNGQTVIPGDVACLVNGESTYSTVGQVALEPGANTITVLCSNALVSDSASVAVTRYSQLAVAITSPADQFHTSTPEVNLAYTVNGQAGIPGDSSCQVKGAASTDPTVNPVALTAGPNQITVSCSNPAASASGQITVFRNQAPGITNIMPLGQPYATSNPDIELWFTKSGYPDPVCTVNGRPSAGHTYETLPLGPSQFTIVCENSFDGETHTATAEVPMLLLAAPVLEVQAPTDGGQTTADRVELRFNATGYETPVCKLNGSVTTSPTDLNLVLGPNTFLLRCENSLGHDEESFTITRNAEPQISVISPRDGQETSDTSIDVEFAATGYPSPACTVNGTATAGQITVGGLEIGVNPITVRCENGFGGEAHIVTRTVNVHRTQPAAVTIDSPLDGFETTGSQVSVGFTATGFPAPDCMVNGDPATSPASVALDPGENTVTVRCVNSTGTGEDSITVVRNGAPEVTVTSPVDGHGTTDSQVDVEFTATGFPAPVCTVNGDPAGSPATVALDVGENTVVVRCENAFGGESHVGTGSVRVFRNQVPAVTIDSPLDGFETTGSQVSVGFTATGFPAPDCMVNGDPATSPRLVNLALELNSITVLCSNLAGSASRTISVIRNREPVPPGRRPVIRRVRKVARVGKPIGFTLDCDSRCRVGVRLKIGRGKVRRLRTVRAPAGSTRKTIRVRPRLVRRIRTTWRKKGRKVRVLLKLSPRSPEGVGRTIRIRLR